MDRLTPTTTWILEKPSQKRVNKDDFISPHLLVDNYIDEEPENVWLFNFTSTYFISVSVGVKDLPLCKTGKFL